MFNSKKISPVVLGGMALIFVLFGCATNQPHRAMAEDLIQTAETTPF